jgi:NADPH-dependent 2,4-dienoyl-CoA reductase/sulfur reductase-like enzyme
LKTLIVGNGVAGVSCALEIRKRDPDAQITIVGKETTHFFSRTALMYAFMDRLKRRDLEPYERDVYTTQKIELVNDEVVNMDSDHRTVSLKSGKNISYDCLVLATGAIPQLFPWQGLEHEAQKQTGASDVAAGLVHFVSMNDLDACEALVPSTQQAVVVGGGLIGIELVECLVHQGIKVSFLIREPFFWPISLCAEEAQIVKSEMARHGVNVICDDEIQKVSKNSVGRICSVETKKGLTIPCQMLGVCAGVKPNVKSFVQMQSGPKVRRGFLVDQRLETSVKGVFAAGDCAEILLPNAQGEVNFESPGESFNELIWYSAKRQGEFVARSVFGDKATYAPPLFFNSSKFFEIEYTTVGNVQKESQHNPSLFLTTKRGRYGLQSSRPATLRIVYDSERVLGFNVLGARVDHTVFERWILERRSLDFCLINLKKAQFDGEFGRVPFEKFESVSLSQEAI